MKTQEKTKLILLSALTATVPLLAIAVPQNFDDINSEAIQYIKSNPTDAIAQLQKSLDSGALKLTYTKTNGYLSSLLKQLQISPSSQMLVFSKTSFQRERISPDTPRALYFNDKVYIGYIPDSPLIEITSVDPQLGAVFYTLNQSPTGKPTFKRLTYDCLQCHAGSMTRNVPGHVIRSVYARRDGQPDFVAGSYLTNDQSPFQERWGGWYVTGKHGTMRHLGNVFAKGAVGQPIMETEKGANITSLTKLFDTKPYLTPYSDIVALMICEHQTHLQNLITVANYQARIAMNYDAMLNKELNRPADQRADSSKSRIRGSCEPLLKAMLFSEETALTSSVEGTSGFAQQFSLMGIQDKQGRSLRTLDLKTRLLKYPCSWLIYSDEFNKLPDIAKNYLYTRLAEVLTNKDTSPDFKHLHEADRKAILEILQDTKPDFAEFFQQFVQKPAAK